MKVKTDKVKDQMIKIIKEIELLNVPLSPNDFKWIQILKEATIKQKKISVKQLQIIIEIRDSIIKKKTFLENFHYYIYTEGCYDDFSEKGGIAFLILDNNKNEIFSSSQGFFQTNYMRMQYKSLVESLKWLQNNLPTMKSFKILIQTDNSLLANTYNFLIDKWMKTDWEQMRPDDSKNKDLILEIFNLKQELPLVEVKYVSFYQRDQFMNLVLEMSKSSYIY